MVYRLSRLDKTAIGLDKTAIGGARPLINSLCGVIAKLQVVAEIWRSGHTAASALIKRPLGLALIKPLTQPPFRLPWALARPSVTASVGREATRICLGDSWLPRPQPGTEPSHRDKVVTRGREIQKLLSFCAVTLLCWS